MKNIFTLLLSIVLLCPTGNVMAQNKARTKIASVRQKGDVVLFTLNSSKPFIFGSNRYYLRIGDKAFTRNEQSHANGKGRITFFIPKGDFNKLQDASNIYLTYGNVAEDDAGSLEELSKDEEFLKCWSLGKFTKTLLKK